MNAIQFLINEHNKVKKVFAKITKTKTREVTKMNLFSALCQDLKRHEKMEETVWYPKLIKKDPQLKVIIKHLVSEEKAAAKTMKTFPSIKTFEKWEEKVKAFKKDVLHHASEEETKLFPKVKKLVDKADLDKLGKAMQAFKKKHTKKK